MADQSGSIEALARALANSLAPLKDLDASNAELVVRELGLSFPAGLASDAGFASSLTTVAESAADLPAIVEELNSAVAAEDVVEIVARGAAVLAAVARTIQAISALDAAIPGCASALLDYLVICYGEVALPATTNVLAFFGLIDRRHVSPSPGQPPVILRKIHLNRLGSLFEHPDQYLGDLVEWGKPGFDGSALFERLFDALVDAPYPISFGIVGGQPGLQSLLFDISLIPVSDPSGAGVAIDVHVPVDDALSLDFPLGRPGWSIHVSTTARMEAGTRIAVRAPAQVDIKPPTGTIEGSLMAEVVSSAVPPDTGIMLLGAAGGSRLHATSFRAGAGLTARWDATANKATADPLVSLALTGGKLHIDTAAGDGFLKNLTSGLALDADFQLAITWSLSDGVKFQGTAGLVIQMPVHLSLGPIELPEIYLSVSIGDAGCPIEVSASLKAALGPITAVVERLGVVATLSFPENRQGNLGPLQFDLDFKPPTGAGLSLDVGIIKGGGALSFDADKGEYTGAMELNFVGIISLKSIAIINTKMPDGSEGFSLLVIITADFPPIQLGFGFTLNAVGGLLGLNRTVNMDALREGVRTNAIKSVLFPHDVVANITRIVSDLKQIFPPLDERFIVGPMAELGWGTPSIITIELGILLEIPVPRVAILGVLAAFLPAEEIALLRIQVNFLGVIDFENKSISFDASLFDSRLLIYTLTGDMAFRLSWGDNPMFILSVGGFHPAYHDAPQDLQHMTRLGISLLSGDNPRISVLSYFAVTSNTVQFGARAELYAEAAGFNVYGFIGFDVLFQFDPFKFVASFEAGLALREGTETIMGIHLAGQLSGINPWNARGEASLTILFFEISVSFDETWGDSADKIEPPKEDIIALLTAEINDNRNWRAEIPESNNLHVSVRKMELPPDQLVIHPMGVLTFSERLVPLGLDITKFGNKVPLDAKRFDIKATDPGILTETVTEEFAPANFFDKNDNEKLSSPSFDRLTSGFKVTGASSLVMPTATNKSVEYELTYLHKKRTVRMRGGKYRMANHVFKASTKASAAAVSTLSYARNRISVNAPDAVAVEPPQYAVANVSDMRLAGPDLVASSYTEASQKYSALIARRPELSGQVQVLAHHELNKD